MNSLCGSVWVWGSRVRKTNGPVSRTRSSSKIWQSDQRLRFWTLWTVCGTVYQCHPLMWKMYKHNYLKQKQKIRNSVLCASCIKSSASQIKDSELSSEGRGQEHNLQPLIAQTNGSAPLCHHQSQFWHYCVFIGVKRPLMKTQLCWNSCTI